MKKSIYLLIVLSIAFWGCSKKDFRDVMPEEAKNMLKNNSEVLILDVRTAKECETGILRGAINLDINNSNFEKQLAQLDKSKPVLVYCASGFRSAKAAGILKQNGFGQVTNLSGGIGAWMSAGGEVVLP